MCAMLQGEGSDEDQSDSDNQQGNEEQEDIFAPAVDDDDDDDDNEDGNDEEDEGSNVEVEDDLEAALASQRSATSTEAGVTDKPVREKFTRLTIEQVPLDGEEGDVGENEDGNDDNEIPFLTAKPTESAASLDRMPGDDAEQDGIFVMTKPPDSMASTANHGRASLLAGMLDADSGPSKSFHERQQETQLLHATSPKRLMIEEISDEDIEEVQVVPAEPCDVDDDDDQPPPLVTVAWDKPANTGKNQPILSSEQAASVKQKQPLIQMLPSKSGEDDDTDNDADELD
eukprot:scpid90757/ scgid20685/ 